ncbi:MAG: cob(I)yrinic acid a,c-diamide adenosyltransferase [Myxococcota bacterium]
MVYISKVYTRSGDDGQTMLASGDRVPKDAARITAYGEVDELNAVLGLIRVEVDREPRREGAEVILDEVDVQLGRIQQELFDLGAELATPSAATGGSKLHVTADQITRIEQEIDAWNEPLEPLTSFILPGGGAVGAMCHLGRTVCRRAERAAVTLAATAGEAVRTEALHYLNRLSDYLFVLARAVSHRLAYDEVLWDAKRSVSSASEGEP